jgi:hypothetical protein
MTIYMTVDLRSKSLRDTLVARAEGLEKRVLSLALGVDEVTWPEGTARETARFYAKNLTSSDKEIVQNTAREVLDTLVNETEMFEDEFWATELGRALFAVGAFPAESMTRATAVKLLGLKSRQHMHHLVVEGILDEDMGGMISVDSVRALMATK